MPVAYYPCTFKYFQRIWRRLHVQKYKEPGIPRSLRIRLDPFGVFSMRDKLILRIVLTVSLVVTNMQKLTKMRRKNCSLLTIGYYFKGQYFEKSNREVNSGLFLTKVKSFKISFFVS
jgi:hypothetical protein